MHRAQATSVVDTGRDRQRTGGATRASSRDDGYHGSLHLPRLPPRMRLKFTKMHGLGNDFVVLDATRAPIALSRDELRRIADRHFGVGCDQILQVEPPRDPATDFYYRIFNADGGEVEQCGNGARCFVRFVREPGLTDKTEIRVGTLSGVIVPRLEADGRVTVDMGVPEFEPARIPFQAERRAPIYRIDVAGRAV